MLLPRGQKNPVEQGSHVLAPVRSWYDPSGHGVHSALLSFGAMLPALQLVGASEPATQNAPGGHGSQSAARLRLLAEEKEPAEHGSGEEAPAGQYEPGSQSLHAVLLREAWKVPALHAMHVAWFSYVPGLHG